MDKTLPFQSRGCRFDPWLGTKVPRALWSVQKYEKEKKNQNTKLSGIVKGSGGYGSPSSDI